ncbi:MAG: hypothetical protein RL220_870, partial [Bacteroidota bacterium]
LCEQGRNFANKIWNAFRLVNGWQQRTTDIPSSASDEIAIRWMRSRLNEAIASVDEDFVKFRISDSLMTVYKLIWDDFCAWYLEMIKPGFEQPMSRQTYEATVSIFEDVLKVLHPFMPFISEEVWQHLKVRNQGEAITISSWPEGGAIDTSLLSEFNGFSELVSGIRNVRKELNLPNRDAIEVRYLSSSGYRTAFAENVKRLCNVSVLEAADVKEDGWYSFVVGTQEFFMPLSGDVDVAAEREKIAAELDYTRGFLESVMKKLSNEKFVNSAPAAVVAAETKKKEDAESKIRIMEEKLKSLS